MIISVPKGQNKEESRHIYTNPINPTICPIHALASYLFLFPEIATESNKIFPGSKQRGRFNRLLHDFLVRHKDTYLQHGEDSTLLGTHSIRKGAARYCCTGTSHGPPVVSVCLRAGWSLGRVKERYLKYKVVGDELVGRTLTGIPATNGDFGISSVYVNEYADNAFFENVMNFIFPIQGKSYPLLAQLVMAFIFHENFIVSTINPNSPLHDSAYFQIVNTDINRFSSMQTSLPWENKFGCPPLTGIPIHRALLNTLLEIQAKNRKRGRFITFPTLLAVSG